MCIKINKFCIVLLPVLLWSLLAIANDKKSMSVETGDGNFKFNGDFYIYYTQQDPKMALRPSEIDKVQYNVITWETKSKNIKTKKVVRKNEQSGDGFDDAILDGNVQKRTADVFSLTDKTFIEPVSIVRSKTNVEFTYSENNNFSFKAIIKLQSDYGFPQLSFTLIPKVKGYFSVVYIGAPKFDLAEVTELWQPMIWQEKRFPDMSYITAAFQCPVPTSLVQANGYTIGVVANPNEYPFEPLPVLENSRFAVALRTGNGQVSPMIVAPVFGGAGSLLEVGQQFRFTSILFTAKKSITQTYEDIARQIYGFTDYRHNDICSLNHTFENIVNYSLSPYSLFIDDQKGCAYSTDVPGAVKNVSGLNPLEISMVTDCREMFEKRAFPIIQYQLSREKFLFSSDSTQKIQSPSRKMAGPVAPVSELMTLYTVLQKDMSFLVDLGKAEFNKNRIRNLEVEEKGNTWQNALWIYKATGDKNWLKKAKNGADTYLTNRVLSPATGFENQYDEDFFFWTGYTPKWIDFLELYEITLEDKYLNAAYIGARHYTMFTWMSPSIPADSIVVNKNGKAPVYWYLQKKGHTQMFSPEEKVPAWRMSEIGLTSESSGTCSGHRAIFMANYSPWMLRLAYYTKDLFLRDVAKAAIIGHYRNFPGYHINTARTSIYEKEDYPLRKHTELSVNSFHYNHILPQASLLLDYLITDTWYRSKKAIHFPDQFIEGYAYLQSKFYGFAKGAFYGEKAMLWMPDKLLKTESVELNYISARSDKKLMIAFSNQSNKKVSTTVELNPTKIQLETGKKYNVRVIADNIEKQAIDMRNGKFEIEVSANGITAVIIEEIVVKAGFQKQLLGKSETWNNDYFESKDAKVRAMILNMGNFSLSAYVYLTDDDRAISSVTFKNRDLKLTDSKYPFEFTIPLAMEATKFVGEIIVTDYKGNLKNLGSIILNK